MLLIFGPRFQNSDLRIRPIGGSFLAESDVQVKNTEFRRPEVNNLDFDLRIVDYHFNFIIVGRRNASAGRNVNQIRSRLFELDVGLQVFGDHPLGRTLYFESTYEVKSAKSSPEQISKKHEGETEHAVVQVLPKKTSMF